MSLLVVTGPPGVGKSTVAALVADRRPRSVLVEGDAFFVFLRSGAIEPWLPESDAQNQVVVEAAAVATGRFARDYATVFDGVVGPWSLASFRAGTGLDALDYVVLLPHVDVCVDRVMTRVGHAFRDEAAARKMHDEFSRAEIEPRHLLVNDADAESAAAEIVERWERGDLRTEAGESRRCSESVCSSGRPPCCHGRGVVVLVPLFDLIVLLCAAVHLRRRNAKRCEICL